MKIIKSLTTTVVSVVAVAVIVVPSVSLAADIRGGQQTTVGNNETITNDLYLAGGGVNNLATVQGDLVAAGGNVLIVGPVSQYVNAAGGTVIVQSNIGGSVRAVGGNILIQSVVGGDVMVAGGQIQITGGKIGRDVMGAGGSVRIDSPVQGNVRFIGGEVYINAPVAGNVEVEAEKVTLGSSAAIAGNFSYKSAREATIESGAKISGQTNYQPLVKKEFKKQTLKFFAAAVMAKFLMILLGAMLFGLFFRKYMTNLVSKAYSQPLMELGRGFIALIILPIVSILLMVTVIGAPLGILGVIGYAGLLIFSCLIAPILIGCLAYKLTTKSDTYEVSWKTILLGVVINYLLGMIPFIGWFVVFGFFLITLGTIVKMKMELAQNWR